MEAASSNLEAGVMNGTGGTEFMSSISAITPTDVPTFLVLKCDLWMRSIPDHMARMCWRPLGIFL